MHNVGIFIKTDFNENHDHYYYHALLNIYLNNMKMLYDNRIEVFDSIDLNKASPSKVYYLPLFFR